MGKSGVIGRKIAATFTSTGTSAIFLHPAEGVHGDLGMVRKDDIVLTISKSGNTEELTQLLPVFKAIGVPIISMVGSKKSTLGENSDVVLDVSVREEACPHDLAPTASTTAQLVMGDALAIALLEKRNFTKEDFAFLHPGGTLGIKLLLKVQDVMGTGDRLPKVNLNASLKEVIYQITSKRFGGTCVVDAKGKLKGIVTDGDLRRLLEREENVKGILAKDIMTSDPKTIHHTELAARALHLMETRKINQLIVINDGNAPIGMIHIHDLVEKGLT
jgi:arabinose-5-phosphate isomerase